MKVALGSIDVDEHTRRALADHYGMTGLAPRPLIRNFVRGNGENALDDVVISYEEGLRLVDEAASGA